MFRKAFHYDWHWVWNTGAGEMGNWGVHVLDDIRNMLFDKCSLPTRVLAGGGRVAYHDAGETPNVHYVYFDTGVVPVVFALSNLPRKAKDKGAPNYRNIQSGYVIQFENGYYAGGRGGGAAYDKDGKRIQSFKGDGGGVHAKNFIAALQKRDPSIQNAEIEQVHYSSAWCHLANIAYRLGKQYDKQQALESVKGVAPWNELIEGFNAHLEANQVDVKKEGVKASAILEIDPQKETFVGASATPDALALLRREYRKGYVMPESV
jgi:hypothetical protein